MPSFFSNDSVTPPNPGEGMTDEDREFLDQIAKKIVEVQMSVPAILFLESVKPLNFLGNQVMVFFNPIVMTIFPVKAYERVQRLLERRDSIEALLVRIENFEAESQAERARLKAERKAAKKAAKESGGTPPEGA